MHLKRLEITGFKSFADNVKLDFEPGITAVVGPNGCGKSNIIDAIRWCLGEMSAKSLRSNLMLDVVFNGSGSRTPGNMAEVTLTFDNNDKRLPIDYSDVSISRRLFRSGESEYFINKTQCRLRDIKELFLDTGMGEDGYSSLEQGKVEWILQAKPEERRELFEEAAGVSKYRARREEALRKLEKVEIDLSRLADIVNVTQEQIRKLENAVTKAKTYQRVRDELKTMEIGDWLHQLTSSDTDLTTTMERLTTAQRSSEELNTKTHQFEAELSELRLALTQLEEELLSANSALNNIDSDVKIGEERRANAQQRETDLVRQTQTLSDSIRQEEERLAELNAQREAQTRSIEMLIRDGQSVETEFAQAKAGYEQAAALIEQKRNQLKEIRDGILDRAQDRTRTQQQLSRFASDLARLESEAANLEKERQRLTAQQEELAQNRLAAGSRVMEGRQQLANKTSAFEGAVAEIQALTSREGELRSALLAAAEGIAKLKGQIQSLQDQAAQDPYLAGTQAILSAGLSGVHGPIARLIQTSDSDRDLVASTLGEHLGDLVADTTEDAQRAVDYVRDSGKGRIRVWILDRLTSVNPDPSALATGDIFLSRIRYEQRYQPVFAHLFSHFLLQGGTVYARAFINGGMDPSRWKSHETLRLPELEARLNQQETEKKQWETGLFEIETELENATHRRDIAVREQEEVRVRLRLSEEELENLEQRHGLFEREQAVVEGDAAQIEQQRAQAQELSGEASHRFDDLQAREQDDHNQLDHLQQEMTEMQQAHATATAELSAKQERHNAFLDKKTWHESILGQTDRDLAAVGAGLDRHRATILVLKEEIGSAQQARNEAEGLIQSSLQKRSEAAEACGAIQFKRVSITEKVQTVESELSRVRSELASSQENVQNERIKEAELRGRSVSLTQKLQDQYELTVELAKTQFAPAMADIETLERLKKRVANMGPINLAAPQEHAELSEKNNFLTTQQSDLLKAKDDLKQVIAKINNTTRDHFRETFEKVRTNFRALYSTLFRGGEADLKFTDETDILNTGIDIFCQPPGKKLLHISLLSGGEKALTAIALLFAFFQVRPSPIALMDEVDAPLDEANVLRYVDMLKQFSQASQFVLISHNKRTMEAANTLYGVTMEELGVSKVLSARLAKAQAQAVEAIPATAG